MLNRIAKKLYIKIAKLLTKDYKTLKVPLEKILMGAEGDTLKGIEYAHLTGNYLRTSTKCQNGPHLKLLKDFEESGYRCLDEINFIDSDYYKNALESIHYFGDYFPYVKSPSDIKISAERFLLQYENKDISKYPAEGHNNHSDLIELRPIEDTDLYQVKAGNHRIAFAIMKGAGDIQAKVFHKQKTKTFFQDIVNKVIWDNGKELYQPIELPEFKNSIVIRKSRDRVNKINKFLTNDYPDYLGQSILDVGSYFGWFLAEYNKMGFEAFGVERDHLASEVAEKFFKINSGLLFKMPIELFINKYSHKKYDFISFLSVLHHFILEKSYVKPDVLFQKLSVMTKRIMFFETGEEHEKMFRGSLDGWNEERIAEFVKQNSDFKKIVKLGRDSDNVGKYSDSYNRMLYAFIK